MKFVPPHVAIGDEDRFVIEHRQSGRFLAYYYNGDGDSSVVQILGPGEDVVPVSFKTQGAALAYMDKARNPKAFRVVNHREWDVLSAWTEVES